MRGVSPHQRRGLHHPRILTVGGCCYGSANHHTARMRDLFRDTFLGFVRVHLLHHATKEAIFGTEMMEELRRHGYALSPGTLYPILHALEAEGYLRSDQQVVGGKVRRYYRSTARGVRTLEKLKFKIRELVDEVLEDKDPPSYAARSKRLPRRDKVDRSS